MDSARSMESQLDTARSDGESLGLPPLAELTAEQEEALDANPRERIYPMNKIEVRST